jgi:hypothetical protein
VPIRFYLRFPVQCAGAASWPQRGLCGFIRVIYPLKETGTCFTGKYGTDVTVKFNDITFLYEEFMGLLLFNKNPTIRFTRLNSFS